MNRYYLAALVMCVLHAVAATVLPATMIGLGFGWFVAYLVLVVSWPLWAFALWQFAATRKGLATAIPMCIGLLILSPVIAMGIVLLSGKSIWPVPQ